MFSVQNFRKTERKKWEFFKISKNGKRLLFKKKSDHRFREIEQKQ